MDLTDLSVIKPLLSRHGFSFPKGPGQNFITDPEVCPKMAGLADLDGETGVLEIGPGIGVLTVELAKRAKKVLALELDARLLPILAKTLDGCGNVFVENADVMKADLDALFKDYFSDVCRVCVAANLPYYITSPIVTRLLESGLPFETMTLMVQKEAGERLCAEIGSRDAGAVTYAVRCRSVPEILFDVPRTAFTPAPKVDSCVIRLRRRETPPAEVEDEAFFFRVVRSMFLHRRKTAVNGLSGEFGLSKEALGDLLSGLGLSPDVRAEAFTFAQTAALAGALKERTVKQQ